MKNENNHFLIADPNKKGSGISKQIQAPREAVKTIKVETEIVNNIFEKDFIIFLLSK